MNQLVKDCGKVVGWNVGSVSLWEQVRHVLQSLINDGFVTVRTRFLITMHGMEYLSDPLRWTLNVETVEETERKVFWSSIYDVFDRALARLLARSQSK